MNWMCLLLTTALVCASCVPLPPVSDRSHQLCGQCARMTEQGALDEAERFCEQALRFSEHNADAWTTLGLIQFRRGNWAQAKKSWIRALRFNPEELQAYSNLCVLYLQGRELSAAERMCLRALKVNPDSAEALKNLSLVHRAQGRRDEERKTLVTMTLVHPELAEPWRELGLLALEDNHLPEAGRRLEHAVELFPDDARAQLFLGTVYEKEGRRLEAASAYRSCLSAPSPLADCAAALDRVTARTPPRAGSE